MEREEELMALIQVIEANENYKQFILVGSGAVLNEMRNKAVRELNSLVEKKKAGNQQPQNKQPIFSKDEDDDE